MIKLSILKNNKKHGFSIIELLITISIIVVISSVVLVNYRKFDSSSTLENLAYDVALSIRQAQSYGVNVREHNSSFDVGYGIHFDSSDKNWILFVDENKNSKYDSGTDDTIESFSLQGGFKLSQVYARTPGNSIRYIPTNISYLDIVFKRPDPDAYFSTSISETYKDAQITIMSPDGSSTRSITINSTGFISISNP